MKIKERHETRGEGQVDISGTRLNRRWTLHLLQSFVPPPSTCVSDESKNHQEVPKIRSLKRKVRKDKQPYLHHSQQTVHHTWERQIEK